MLQLRIYYYYSLPCGTYSPSGLVCRIAMWWYNSKFILLMYILHIIMACTPLLKPQGCYFKRKKKKVEILFYSGNVSTFIIHFILSSYDNYILFISLIYNITFKFFHDYFNKIIDLAKMQRFCIFAD